MKNWIEKNLDPPGMERKNQRSIFSFIGRVFGIVKNDAIKAHNAFFPYLCDEDKLRQHGNSLMIPEIPFDTEKTYRDRVATASFYLMRAGERAYICEQLQARLGNRYIIDEEFLEIYLLVSELTTEERIWAYSFLDSILDPNISFSVAKWIDFTDTLSVAAYPELNSQISILASENDAQAHMSVVPILNCQISILASENDAQAYMSVVPILNCQINILQEEIL